MWSQTAMMTLTPYLPPDLTLITTQTTLHSTCFQRPRQTELNNASCLVLKITRQPCSMMTCMLSYLFSFLLSNNLCFPFLTFLWLNTGPVTPEADISFLLLKQALQIAPTLGLPDHNKPFVLYVDECNGYIVIC